MQCNATRKQHLVCVQSVQLKCVVDLCSEN